MQQGQPPQAAPPQGLNWPAIHAAFGQHVQQPGNAQGGQPMQPGQQPQPQVGGTPSQTPMPQGAPPPQAGAPQPMPQGQPGAGIPQPMQNSPAYATLIQAMAKSPKSSGDDPEMTILKSFADHLKRITPDVSAIHKGADQKPNTGGGAY